MMAANLVKRGVNVIVATGGEQSALASKEMTQSIPIVFIAGSDPVRQGLVASLNRPGGNLTGTFLLTVAIESKRLGLLRKLVPNAAVIGMLLNPNSPAAELQRRDIPDAARTVGQRIVIVEASNEQEIDAAFAALVQQQIGAGLMTAPYRRGIPPRSFFGYGRACDPHRRAMQALRMR
jgi:putative ABC transport system substrate-binding protein